MTSGIGPRRRWEPDRRLHPRLRLGTSSWSSTDWKGPFYPPALKPGEFLRFYATRFDTVEVDSTFYRAPPAAFVRKWVRDTPPDFRFALKVPRTITHEKVLWGCREEFDAFLETVSELGERLGFLLFQFGYFSRRSACPSPAEFLDRMAAFFPTGARSFRAVVEIRNPRRLEHELLSFLRERKLILALTDQEWMPAFLSCGRSMESDGSRGTRSMCGFSGSERGSKR